MSLAFISYSSRDRERARRVAELARVRGLEVWMDEGSLVPGQPIAPSLADAIARADVFIPLLTKNSVKSRWVQYELSRARNKVTKRRPRIIPLVFDDCRIPRGLTNLKRGDCRTAEETVRSINLALSKHGHRFPLRADLMRRRYKSRSPVRYAVRLVPSKEINKTNWLGPKERKYVFVGDYAEQCGRSLRQVLSNLWAGDAYDRAGTANYAWTALVFEVGDLNVRKLDLLPATWKAMFRVVSDPRRLEFITVTRAERKKLGRRPPYDYYTKDQQYWYNELTRDRVWRVHRSATRVDGRQYLERIFGFSWWCYDGSGITAQRSRSSLMSHSIPSRLFLVKNGPISPLNCRLQSLGHVDEGQILI